MSKKDRMLEHITNNVNWFLNTNTSIEVIPYYSLSNSVFSRAKDYIATSYVDKEDVVCLVSTSILEPGKSGILFTTDAMYCKSWGILTTKYENYYFCHEYAEFDLHNDFHENRMKELMEDLNQISIDEDEDKQVQGIIDKAVDAGKKVGMVALGGMALLDLITSFSDGLVSNNNNQIANEISKLENSDNVEVAHVMPFYKNYIPLLAEFGNECEMTIEDDNEMSEEVARKILGLIRDILVELYSDALKMLEISPEDEEYEKCNEWLVFWAMLFGDNELFREQYPSELLKDMPEVWDGIINNMEELLEDEWEDSFADEVHSFANAVLCNTAEMLELMQVSELDDEFIQKAQKLMESNRNALESLADVLDEATDFLSNMLGCNGD